MLCNLRKRNTARRYGRKQAGPPLERWSASAKTSPYVESQRSVSTLDVLAQIDDGGRPTTENAQKELALGMLCNLRKRNTARRYGRKQAGPPLEWQNLHAGTSLRCIGANTHFFVDAHSALSTQAGDSRVESFHRVPRSRPSQRRSACGNNRTHTYSQDQVPAGTSLRCIGANTHFFVDAHSALSTQAGDSVNPGRCRFPCTRCAEGTRARHAV
jgi:hypothetical protein